MKALLFPFFITTVVGAPLQSAKITQAVNEVKVMSASSRPRDATIGETISGSTSLRTGRRSRAEMVFKDDTVTRLGQNSIFSFRPGGREVELQQGSVLLQVPKDAGGATIRTATVTAAITGTTSMFEYSPDQWVKLLTLEGVQRLYLKDSDEPVFVPAGQMIIMHPDAQRIPAPVTIDLAKLLATSPLAGDKVFGPLSADAKAAIASTVDQQTAAKREGLLRPTRHVISGPGSRGATLARDIRQGERLPDGVPPIKPHRQDRPPITDPPTGPGDNTPPETQ